MVARTDVESLFIQRNLFHFGTVCFVWPFARPEGEGCSCNRVSDHQNFLKPTYLENFSPSLVPVAWVMGRMKSRYVVIMAGGGARDFGPKAD